MTDPVLTEAAPTERAPRIKVNPPVFFVSAALILAFALFGAVFPDNAERLFAVVQATIIVDFGWFYVLAVAGFLVFVLFLMMSRYGDVKLGPDESEAEYSYLSWFAMLFSAGMGIGLLFFGVAEPVQHYALPPIGEGRTIEAARQALPLTFFHWGLHAWAVYIVVGLALAYFAFRRGLPLTIRSALFPLIGDRIYGPIGHAIDIFAVLGTMFGVATSLGFGVLQVNAGFNYLFGLPTGPLVQVLLIAAITGLATISAAAGLDAGIKRLSELNIILAVSLLLFVLFAGSTIFLLQAYVQNIGAYLGTLVQRTFRMYAYEPNPWLGNWTLFYWGWWISWSPFVGMFIARISRGRTIREFIAGVLLVPALFTFLWMTVFGNTAIQLDLAGAAPIAQTVANDMPLALFETLGQLPLSAIASGIATLLVITFFVTSADSGALVIDMITNGAAEDPPVWQRIFWALCAGLVAAVLLLAGGLQALQTAAIASALPFAVVMVFICYGLLRALQTEARGSSIDLSVAAETPPPARTGLNWQQRLDSITHYHEKREIAAFLEETARPALDEIAEQMRGNNLSPRFEQDDDHLDLTIPHGDHGAFRYTVRARGFRAPSFAFAEAPKARRRAPALSGDGAHVRRRPVARRDRLHPRPADQRSAERLCALPPCAAARLRRDEMPRITPLHLEHGRHLFLAERSRREAIRGSLSTPVAAISFAVFALGTLAVEVDAQRWREWPTFAIFVLGATAVAALFASAWQVVRSEWLFVYHEPPRLADLISRGDGAEGEERVRGLLTASYAVAYEQ